MNNNYTFLIWSVQLCVVFMSVCYIYAVWALMVHICA